jgi:hypothetical protein
MAGFVDPPEYGSFEQVTLWMLFFMLLELGK